MPVASHLQDGGVGTCQKIKKEVFSASMHGYS